ncbi:diguanylate cyclase [Anaerotignum lactatifermentans]|uniref:Diguanylate cyclase n=1 Tax=Anaerotignum lactatifermentans TaxID=160404 RepID=A0ABS2GC47_9FIRM|nr:GGDEF domain-containing protein [Anaerotignum lactatifermentans]MBM6830192.1 diguanylate cyclase [Anaerotignum lactatifermentans]MBM6878735.1 diguanylate cyclase [Anaerotignum lactatifermentans]MBM6951799.1 diguanylate cyclase [Anaerotignum lactatifermentans]
MLLHKHYSENDSDFIVAQMDKDIIWIGAGENEVASGFETVSRIFLSYRGLLPKCILEEEEMEVQQISGNAYLCSGRLWIRTDPETQVYLRVHQRFTFAFRWQENGPKCTYIHISNPYEEMKADESGFPIDMAYQSYLYMKEQLDAYKKQIQAQTEVLKRMSYKDMLTGVYNRNKFIMKIEEDGCLERQHLGLAYFDLNGLKTVNDIQGHSAGDKLICSMVSHLWRVFEKQVYRTGGDEFVVIEEVLSETAFLKKLWEVKKAMAADGISFAMGISWRTENCCIKEQFEEADRNMYEEKRMFYSRNGEYV